MKRQSLILILLISFFCGIAQAQLLPGGAEPENNRPVTEAREHSGMILLGLKGSEMDSKTGIELGFDITGRLDDNFNIGATMYYLMSRNILIETGDPKYKPVLNLFYLGMNADYTLWLGGTLGISIGAALSVGQVNITESPSVDISYSSYYQWIFFAEPGINLIWKLSDGFGISAGAGYRQAMGVSRFGLDNRDLSSPVFKLAICSFL